MQSNRLDPRFEIMMAFKQKDIQKITAIIRNGLSVTTVIDGLTLIQHAKKIGGWECVLAVAEAPTDSSDAAKYGNILLEAVQENKLEVVKKLLKAGAKPIWIVTATRNTCLHIAVLNNNTDIIVELMHYGASTSVENEDRQTPIMLATNKNHWDCVAAIAESDKTHTEDYGNMLLMAARKNEISAVKSLLRSGATCNWHTNPDENTALHHAVINQNPKLISLLMTYDKCSNVIDRKNKENKTPFSLAEEMHSTCLTDCYNLQQVSAIFSTLLAGYMQQDNILHLLPLDMLCEIFKAINPHSTLSHPNHTQDVIKQISTRRFLNAFSLFQNRSVWDKLLENLNSLVANNYLNQIEQSVEKIETIKNVTFFIEQLKNVLHDYSKTPKGEKIIEIVENFLQQGDSDSPLRKKVIALLHFYNLPKEKQTVEMENNRCAIV